MGSVIDIWPAPRQEPLILASLDEVRADLDQQFRDMWDSVKFVPPRNPLPERLVAWPHGLDRPGMTATEICDWYDQQKAKNDRDRNPCRSNTL